MATILTPWLENVPSGRYAFNQWATDGQHVNFQINFAGVAPGYLAKGDVKYYVTDLNGTVITAVTVVPVGNFTSDTVINMTSDTIGGTTGVPIPTGYYLFIFRDTPKDKPEPDFNDGSVIDETNLDTGFRQAVYVAAEMVDKFGVTQDDAGNALAFALDAEAKAAAAVATANTANSTAGSASSQAATAVSTANTAKNTADGAVITAGQALSTANGIDAKATTALANSAAAVSTANAIDAKAQSALDASAAATTVANTAAGNAATALSTANGVDAKATLALSNSSTALGTANAAAAAVLAFSGKNLIHNGEMRIAQQVAIASLVGNVRFGGPDRFACVLGGSGTGGFNQSQVTANLPNGAGRYWIQHQVTSIPTAAFTGTQYWGGIVQTLEGYNAYRLRGQQATLSFWFMSYVAGTYSAALQVAAGTAQSCVQSFTYTTANVPQYITLTFAALPATATVSASASAQFTVRIAGQQAPSLQTSTQNTWLTGRFDGIAGTTMWSNTNGGTIKATEIQLEIGTVATAFEAEDIAVTQQKCERFYQLIYPTGGYYAPVTGAQGFFPCVIRTPMMTLPSQVLLANGTFSGVGTTTLVVVNAYHAYWNLTSAVAAANVYAVNYTYGLSCQI